MRAPFFLSALIAAIVLFAAVKTVFGQTAPQPPMVIEPADADAFREIVAVTPPPYNALFIRWYTTILQRWQAKAAAEAKVREDSEKK